MKSHWTQIPIRLFDLAQRDVDSVKLTIQSKYQHNCSRMKVFYKEEKGEVEAFGAVNIDQIEPGEHSSKSK